MRVVGLSVPAFHAAGAYFLCDGLSVGAGERSALGQCAECGHGVCAGGDLYRDSGRIFDF